ncbi:MAG: hypothetical protein GY870_07985, partial [archaeon]|nr:hypothetical protein [archaeon]
MEKEYIFEKITENEENEDYNVIKLEDLTEDAKNIINPLVPPTSGLRMEIFEIENEKYTLKKQKLFHFIRVIKGISLTAKEELGKDNPSVLIVSDDRPSADILLNYSSRIFFLDGYKIYHQEGEGEKTYSYIRGLSKMSTPYASASVALLDEIDVVLVLTASHNSLEWNGCKYYIKVPIPILGGVMKKMSKYAIDLSEVKLSKKYEAEFIDADKINNDYIIKLVSKIIDLSVLKGKKIIIWPLLGASPEIKDLFERCQAEVILIDEDRDSPDPTKGIDQEKIKKLMKENDVKISIILDADRDRIIFLVKVDEEYIELSPNELYTAMHSILITKFKKKIINVRTIPSNPGGDSCALINYISGVGYKHLGLIQYLVADKDVPQSQLESGILYVLKNNRYTKLKTREEIKDVILNAEIEGELIFVLWEESGGHTFNILTSTIRNGILTLESEFPLIGDKYPAPAMLILCSLLESGYNLTEFMEKTIIGD